MHRARHALLRHLCPSGADRAARRRMSAASSVPTIFALSSGRGRSGVAVLRLSGPGSGRALRSLTPSSSLPPPRVASLRTFRLPGTGEVLDRGLALWFPGPRSFTGEDCAELQVHGSPAVVTALLGALARMEGLRSAEPGEFSKRALLAGKMDLAQAEGLGDLIHAETEQQRKQAIRQMEGSLSKVQKKWRGQILRLVAHVEAYIDFSESEEIEDGVLDQVKVGVSELVEEFDCHLYDVRAGERLRSGVRVAVIGAPNAGKSSFLNLLAERDAAIVSPTAGTTRDVVEAPLDIGGFPVLVLDTAGLRESKDMDPVEAEGIARAVKNANSADLIVFIVDCNAIETEILADPVAVKAQAEQMCKQFGLHRHVFQNMLVFLNKSDLLQTVPYWSTDSSCFLSCVSKSGANTALRTLQSKISSLCQTLAGEAPALTRARHAAHLKKARDHLEAFIAAPSGDLAVDAQELRLAAWEVGFIAGTVSSEHILDTIFADFCIGK